MPAKVLVADDDEKFRNVIETGLKADYEVLSAADGQIGVQMAQKHMPQVILVDVDYGFSNDRRIKH